LPNDLGPSRLSPVVLSKLQEDEQCVHSIKISEECPSIVEGVLDLTQWLLQTGRCQRRVRFVDRLPNHLVLVLNPQFQGGQTVSLARRQAPSVGRRLHLGKHLEELLEGRYFEKRPRVNRSGRTANRVREQDHRQRAVA
jgi:hypothetical protein